jgi:phenylacetate-CoA ligase
MENVLVEIVDEENRPVAPGQEGRVLLTDLYNYGMPFIRYANGDRAIAGRAACSCGRGLPLLNQVTGRQSDILQTPDGRHVSGLFFPHFLKEFPAVVRYQVVQEQLDRVQLRVVLSAPLSESDQESLEQQVHEVLGPEVRFELLPVESIPLTKAGKMHVVVNRVQSPSRERADELATQLT